MVWEVRNSVYGSLSYLSQSVFWGTLLLAAWSDWKYYRIPNRLIIFGIVSGIMSLVFQAADLEAGSKIPWLLLALSGFLVRGVAVLVLGIFLHSLGMIGAADLKLVALLAGLFGNNKNFMCRIYLRGCLVPSKNVAIRQRFSTISLFVSLYQADTQQ